MDITRGSVLRTDRCEVALAGPGLFMALTKDAHPPVLSTAIHEAVMLGTEPLTDQTLLEIFSSAIWCYLVLLAAIGGGFPKAELPFRAPKRFAPKPPRQNSARLWSAARQRRFPPSLPAAGYGRSLRAVGGVPHRNAPQITRLCTPSCPPGRGPSAAPPTTDP